LVLADRIDQIEDFCRTAESEPRRVIVALTT
jgi:hypothetical protein